MKTKTANFAFLLLLILIFISGQTHIVHGSPDVLYLRNYDVQDSPTPSPAGQQMDWNVPTGTAASQVFGSSGDVHYWYTLRYTGTLAAGDYLLTLHASGASGNGFVWLDSPVAKTYTTTSAWTDLDVSAECPSGATGVIIAEVAETTTSNLVICVRGKEDTNNYMSTSTWCEIEAECWRMQIVKLNTDRVIQYYSSNTALKIYVMGYTVGTGPKYKTVPVDLGSLTSGSWQSMDVTAYVDDDTDGLILFVQSTYSSDARLAVRAVGSSNDHSAREWEEYNIGLMVVKIDANDVFQYYVAQTSAKIYLVAETKGSIDYLTTNFVDMSATATGWTMRDLDSYATVPADASGCFLQHESTGSFFDYMNYPREYGQTWTWTYSDVGGDQEMTGGCGINGDNQIEIYCENLEQDVYLHAITRYISAKLDFEVAKTAPDGSSSLTIISKTAASISEGENNIVIGTGAETSFNDQRLRLKILWNTGTVTIYWDGADKQSRLTTPSGSPPIPEFPSIEYQIAILVINLLIVTYLLRRAKKSTRK